MAVSNHIIPEGQQQSLDPAASAVLQNVLAEDGEGGGKQPHGSVWQDIIIEVPLEPSPAMKKPVNRKLRSPEDGRR